MVDADLAFGSIERLAGMVRKREISSVELTRFFLSRLERFGAQLNCVVTLLPERALAEARAADNDLSAGRYHGPLHGIPYGAKDLLAARGAPTTWGAAPYREQRFDYDATVVRRLRASGAVLAAKLAMIELAGAWGYDTAGASFTGPCKNPWNVGYWSGGSSSGPGSAVAAGLVPFAIGSETDGSIMNPSAYSGLSGLRPTYGRVSRHGAMALSWTLDKIGPLCRTASDTMTVLGAIAGRDANDASSVRRPAVHEVAQKSTWRIGLVKHAADKVQPAVRRNFENAVASLGAAAAVSEIELPRFPYDAMVGSIIYAEAASAFRQLIQSGAVQTLADPDLRREGYSALVTYAVDYVDAQRMRQKVRRSFADIFRRVDVLAAPTYSTVSTPIAGSLSNSYPGFEDGPLITACNLAGIPAVSVPSGFGDHGLPTGIMFVSAAFAEATSAGIASRFQRATDWHQRRPPVFSA